MKIEVMPNGVTYVHHKKKELVTLQLSDVHYDSHKCDRELLTKHLKEAEKRKAFVFINGDFFDLMGGKYDPRSTYGMIRPEYKDCNYLDKVIEDGADYLSKFKVTYFIGEGNHESNIRKRLHTDPLSRLVQLLKSKGVTVERGDYTGYIVYRIEDGTRRTNTVQHYHHGYGGNAPRSKGVLNVDINIKRNPDADIITRGHDHNKWYVPQVVQRISGSYPKHVVEDKRIHVLQTGSYKMLGTKGWAVEKGFDRPVLGGWWVTITQRQTKQEGMNRTINDIQVVEAF